MITLKCNGCGQCIMCRLSTNPRYAGMFQLTNGTVVALTPTIARSVAESPDLQAQYVRPWCSSRLAATGEMVECPSCRGRRTRVKLFGCAIYGTCLPEQEVDGIKCCKTCTERTPIDNP